MEFLLPWADAEEIGVAHAIVRKLAHVTEYAILALLTFRALDDPNRTLVRIGLWTLVLCAAYAASDEFHQAFVGSRTGAPADVLLDTVGAGFGVGIAAWVGWPFSSDRRLRA